MTLFFPEIDVTFKTKWIVENDYLVLTASRFANVESVFD